MKTTTKTTAKKAAPKKPRPKSPLPPPSYVTIKGKRYERGTLEAIEAASKAYVIKFKEGY